MKPNQGIIGEGEEIQVSFTMTHFVQTTPSHTCDYSYSSKFGLNELAERKRDKFSIFALELFDEVDVRRSSTIGACWRSELLGNTISWALDQDA